MKPRLARVLFPIILLTGFLVACQAPYHQADERYFFVAFNTSLPYWQEAAAGLEDSAKQLGVKAELTGPANFSVNDEVSAFQQAVTQHASGILVSAANPEAFREPIDSAIQQGIPVICVDADSPESKRILFVGTDNLRAGEESGKRMAELLHGKGNVVIITIPGQYNLGDRVRGVEEAFKKYPGIKIPKTIDDKGDSRNAYDAITALLQGKDKPDGIIGLEASGGAGAADALHRVDLTGKIPIVAFDKDPETLDWIQRGVRDEFLRTKIFRRSAPQRRPRLQGSENRAHSVHASLGGCGNGHRRQEQPRCLPRSGGEPYQAAHLR